MCVSVPWGKRHSFRKKKKKNQSFTSWGFQLLKYADWTSAAWITPGCSSHAALGGNLSRWDTVWRFSGINFTLMHTHPHTHTLCDPGLIRTSQNTLFLQGVSPLQWHLGMCSSPACACFKMDWWPYLFPSDLSPGGFVWGPVKRREGDIIWRTPDLFDLQKTAYGQLPSFTTKLFLVGAAVALNCQISKFQGLFQSGSCDFQMFPVPERSLHMKTNIWASSHLS